MDFKILKIDVNNFRCFEQYDNYLSDEVNVFADNEVGKSTLASAILWCLTGKDIEGNTSFEIVTAGKYGVESTHVELECNIGEKPITLKREYKAKFTRDKVFSDYATVCYVNGVETGVRDFQERIRTEICNDDLFKIISNPKTFMESCPKNQKELEWQAQRRWLLSLVNEQPLDAEIAKSDTQWAKLQEPLKRYNSVSEYCAFLKAEISKTQKDIDNFNVRIEQQGSNLNHDISYSLSELELNLKTYEQQLNEIEKENNIYKQQNTNNDSLNLLSEIANLQNERTKLLEEYQVELAKYKSEKEKLLREAETNKVLAKQALQTQAKYAKAIEEITNTPIETNCKACGQKLENQSVTKAKAYASHRVNKGKALAEDESIKAKNFHMQYQKYFEQAEKLQEPVYPPKEKELTLRIEEFTQSISNQQITIGNLNGYEEKKAEATAKRDELLKIKYTLEQNEKVIQEVEKLRQDHKDSVIKLYEYQSLYGLSKEFISVMYANLEKTINSQFKNIVFELFEKNKSNEDIKECCNMTFNGHKYQDLSESTKLIVNMELIEAFQKAYDITVPIMIDNMESVTSDIINPAQLIKLHVKEELCPKCGGKSGRRNPQGNWTCSACGNIWIKQLKLVKKGED